MAVILNMDLMAKYSKIGIDYGIMEKHIQNSKFNIEKVDGKEIHIEITPDRLDLASNEGMAYFISNLMGKPLKIGSIEESNYMAYVDAEKVSSRPYIGLALVKGINLTDEEIKYMINYQELLAKSIGNNRKIASIGLYPVNDKSFPLRYTGEDFDKIHFVPLDYNTPLSGFQILNEHPKGVMYRHLAGKNGLVIKDANNNIMSMVPITNSEMYGKISEDTNFILVEVTGTIERKVEEILNLMVFPFLLHSSKVMRMNIDYGNSKKITPNWNRRSMKIKKSFFSDTWGIDFRDEDLSNILSMQGYEVSVENDFFDVAIPPFRIDVLNDIDVVEDVGIAYGYDNIQPTQPSLYTEGLADEREEYYLSFEDYFIGYGFTQSHNMILGSYEDMHKATLSPLKIKNPVSSLFDSIRPNIAFSLLQMARTKKNLPYPQKFFERGIVVRKEDNINMREISIGCLWLQNGINYTDAKSIVDFILEHQEIKSTFATFVPSSKGFLLKGRGADIKVGDIEIGFVGEVDVNVLRAFSLTMPSIAIELYLDAIYALKIKGQNRLNI